MPVSWGGQRDVPALVGAAWVARWGGWHHAVVVSTLVVSTPVVSTEVVSTMVTTTFETTRVETTTVETAAPPWSPL